MVARVLIAVVLLASGCSAADTSTGTATRVRFTTDTATVDTGQIEIADSDAERSRGLMGRTGMAADDGMLFVFDDPSAGSFWMKDTLIPLSIAFWGEDGRIHTILEMTPCAVEPCETYPADAPYTFALEMNAGWFATNGVEVGDRADVEPG